MKAETLFSLVAWVTVGAVICYLLYHFVRAVLWLRYWRKQLGDQRFHEGMVEILKRGIKKP